MSLTWTKKLSDHVARIKKLKQTNASARNARQ